MNGIWKWAEHKVDSGERDLEVGGAQIGLWLTESGSGRSIKWTLVSGIWKLAEHKVDSGERNLEVGGAQSHAGF